NTATSFGGGAVRIELLNSGSGGVRISNSTFTGNIAGSTGLGSAITVSAEPVIITNCTVAGNIAGTGGGAIDFEPRTPTTVMNNTIIAGNSGGNCSFGSGGAFTGTHNLQFGDSTCTGATVANPLLGRSPTTAAPPKPWPSAPAARPSTAATPPWRRA